MKLKTISQIRAIFLVLIIITVVLEIVMDTRCMINHEGHQTLYILDIFCYFSIFYTELLQIDLIWKVIKRQEAPTIRGNLKCYQLFAGLAIILLINHISWQSYFMSFYWNDIECYYFMKQGRDKLIIFGITVVTELLVLVDIGFVFHEVWKLIFPPSRRPSLLEFYKYIPYSKVTDDSLSADFTRDSAGNI